MPETPTPLDLDGDGSPFTPDDVELCRARTITMRARPAPAWDEDSARCCTGDASQHDGHHKSCRYVHGDLRPDPDDRETLADAVLDLLPGRSEAEVKAEALREFAARVRDEMDASDKAFGTKWATGEYRHAMRSALMQVDEEADRLAAEGGDDRG